VRAGTHLYYTSISLTYGQAGQLGCLTVLGIATGDHVVGLSGSQSVANAGFQLTESGPSTAGEILSESLLGFWELIQGGQDIAEHGV